jgi:hypothetical protein
MMMRYITIHRLLEAVELHRKGAHEMASGNQDVHEDDMRTDLEAMLKASRDLGPAMDRALVDSYLERQRNAIKQSKREAPRQPQPAAMAHSGTGPHPMQVLMLGMVLAAVVAVLVFSHGWMFWMIFPLFWIFGPWRWSGRGDRHQYRMARRQARDDYRRQRWQAREDYWRERYDGSDHPTDYI